MPEPFNGLYFDINGFEFGIQQAVFHWLAIALIVGIGFIVIGQKLKKADPNKPPKGVVLLAEIFANFITGFVKTNSGTYNKPLVPYISVLAVMLLFSNLIGLLGFQAPTTNLGINATLALITFFLIQYRGIKKNKFSHFKGLLDPHPVFLPINLFGELAVPVSLSVRLFANILSGSIIMLIIYTCWYLLADLFLPSALLINATAPFLHIYFDVFSGFIQTYVFLTLTLFFIGQKTE